MPTGAADPLDREALFAEMTLSCDHAQAVRVVGDWMPVAHEGVVDKVYAVTAGRGTLFLNGDRYDLIPGQALLIPAGTVQQGESDATDPLVKTYVHFSSVTTDALHLLRFFPPPTRLAGPSAAAIARHCGALLDEWEHRRPGRQLALKTLLYDLLLGAYRAAPADIRPADGPGERAVDRRAQSDAHYDTIRHSLSLMSRRLGEPLTLADLAADACLSEGHFNRLFRRLVGVPPMRFLETRRMRRAQELLAMTDAPVAQVAERVGFADPNYFSRAFQRFTGRAPTAYRAGVRVGGSGGAGSRKSR